MTSFFHVTLIHYCKLSVSSDIVVPHFLLLLCALSSSCNTHSLLVLVWCAISDIYVFTAGRCPDFQEIVNIRRQKGVSGLSDYGNLFLSHYLQPSLIKFYVFYVLFNFRYVKAHVFQSKLVFRRFPQTDNKMKSYPWYASNVRLDVLFVLHCSSFLNFRFPQIVVLKPPLTLIFPTKGWCPGARHWLLPTRAWMAYNVCCNQPAQSGYNWIKLDFLGPRRPEPKLWGVQQPGRRGQGTGEQREDR